MTNPNLPNDDERPAGRRSGGEDRSKVRRPAGAASDGPPLPVYPPLGYTKAKGRPQPPSNGSRRACSPWPAVRRPGVKALYFFCIGLRSCLAAGTPILTALHLMAETAGRRSLRKACLEVAREVGAGRPIAEALRARRRVFPRFFTNVFLAGLESGSLTQSLDELIEHYAWVMELRSNILRVVWYPIFLLFAGSLIMSAPAIVLHFRGTAFHWVEAAGIAWSFFQLPLLGLIAAYVATRIVKSPPVRPLTDEIVARIPIIGTCLQRYALAIFFRVLAASVAAGREIGTGFRAALDSMDNHRLARRLRAAERFLRDGDTLTYALSRTRVFDAQALGMVEAGEISGALPELAGRMAGYYMDATKALLPGLIKACFPLTLLVVAVAYFINPHVLFVGSFLLFFLLFLTV